MNKEDAKVINIGDSSPINISLVDNTPIPVVVDVIKNEPQPIEVYSNTSIISGAANLYELGDVASDGHQVLDSGDKKVLMLNADNKHPGKWMAGKVNLSEYAKKTELDEISNNIENTNKDLSGVKEDLLEKEAFLDGKIAEIKGNLEKTKDELIVTQKELVDAKNELSDARHRLEEQGVTVEMVVGQVNDQEQKITTAITNIESESDRVNILRSEMDGINLTITNEILSQLNEDGSDITLKIGQKIDARAETIETAVKKLREGTDETMVSWIGQKIDGRAETIETAIKKLQTGEDAELVSWVGQKIDARAETIETAVAKLREGTDETMVSWVGQKIDAKAETITTAVIEFLEQEGFATKEFVGQEIDGAKKSVTTGIMTFITEQDFSTKSFVGQEIDGAEGRITTAYEKYVEDKGYATTTFVGQEIDGVNKTITTAVAESKESIVGEDGVINSRIQAAYTSWDITGIKNSVVDQNGNYIKSSEINQKADNILITVQENDEGYKGRFSSIEANLDGVSTIIANGDNYAAIIARVNEDSSSVTIEAKKINLLGETVARELSAIKATINELTLTNAHVSGVVECVINDTVYWQLLNDGSGTLAKGNIKWNPDGSGSLASGNINWDINGNAVFNGSIESGSGKIAGWTINADSISSNREGANTKLFSNGHLVNEETDENGKLWKHWEFNYDGSGSIANNSLSWDPYGYIKLGDDVILGANELRVAQLISNVSLLLSMFELDENGDIKTKDYYADGAWHSRGLYSPSFISSGGKSNTPGTGGGTVVGATVGGVDVKLKDGILEFDAYPTAASLGLGNIAFKDSLAIADIANLQSDLDNKQRAISIISTNLSSHIGDSTIHITAAERTSWNNKYDKPASGIPYTDLADSVKSALDKAHEHANKTSVLDKLKWDEAKNAIYIGDENNRINFFVYGGVASGGFSDTPGAGGGTVVGATVGGKEVTLSGGILEFDAYPTTVSLGLKNLAFKDSLAVSEVVGLQSALSNKQDVLGYAPIPRNSNVSDYSVWNDSDWGFSEWAPSSQGITNNSYGTSFNFRDATTWYFRLMFGTNGRIYHYSGINTTTMTNQGTLAYLSDIPTNNNQLTNGAGYITSSGSCAYATSAGSAPASDVYAWAKKSSLELADVPDLSSKYLSVNGGTIKGTGDKAYVQLHINGESIPNIVFEVGSSSKGVIGWAQNEGMRFANGATGAAIGIKDNGTPYFNDNTLIHSGNIGGYNAGSATKLATARTIWGQSFDGTGDVSGALTGVTDITASGYVRDAGLGYISNKIEGIGWHTVARLSYFHETADIYISNTYVYHPTQGLHIRIANGIIEVLSNNITTITKVRFVDKDVDIYYSVENFDYFHWRVIGNGCGIEDGSISTKTGGYECVVNAGVSVNSNLMASGNATIAGNVLIGTTSDYGGKIQVNGYLRFVEHGVHLAANGPNGGWANTAIISSGWEGGIEDFTEINVSASGANTASIRLIKNGNVGIGTTSPSAKLHVAGNILATGAVTAGQASDARLKSNIVTILNACGILRSLRGVEFNWNAIATENCKDLTGHDVGLIAQEVESLIPSAIGTIWNKYKRLDYIKITPYLVEGWKAHDDEIQRLKVEIIELKKKIYGLEKQ